MSARTLAASGMHILATGKIEVGDHITRKIFGLTIDVDIVWSTLAAGAIVLLLGFILRAKVTSGVPGKLQLFWETLVGQAQSLADSAIGPEGRPIVPLAVVIFLMILICDYMELIPSGHSPEYLPAPTSDVNLPAAMAVFVVILVHRASIKARGFRGYLRHYLQPYKIFLPINIIEEITKPITLTFRLFGNVFSGGLMISVMVALLPIYVVPIGEIIWKPFDVLFIGALQAYIFALLTVIYFGMAMTVDEAH
jgi:F-type H+-transporting ATPase subunit a